VATSFIIAEIVILILGFTVYYFLESLNNEIEEITSESNKVTLLTDEIRISAVSILKYQRRILTNRPSPEFVERLINLCEGFTSQLQNIDTIYESVEIKQVIAKMLGYVDSLKLILKKALFYERDASGLSSIGDLADKILEAFTEFQDIQYFQNAERDKRIKGIVRKTKRNMMYTLIITFIGVMLLGLVIPGKIALPFKKVKDAIRELQECKFDVSIYYNQDDEIGEISREMNKMIVNLKKFEELRADRILVEGRKFDALANMVSKYILVANANHEIIYMNNDLYSLLQLQTDDVIFKNMNDTLIPQNIIDAYTLAIKRRSKIENMEIIFWERERTTIQDNDHHDHKNEKSFHDFSTEKKSSPQEEATFKGYANIIPIRGKESSLDYYLMVLSNEVFA
jgi:soluble P-type ATPase